MEFTTQTGGNEMTASPKNIADMYCVSWEHEYFTDDDAASFDTLAEAQAFETKLRELGKRRIRIDGPGIDADDEDF
jgi:hypothetical protein